ncbi:MAG: helix-turn-helix transcriptional regulator [Pseudomonadota bacterium]|nr:helix-turn-helix transcriptional regulator [Pseudomonadota bacterium]
MLSRWPQATSRTGPVPERDHDDDSCRRTHSLVAEPVVATDLYERLIAAIVERWPETCPIAKVADVGRIIADRRRELGFTQGQLARMASVGRRFVSELENGKDSSQMGEALRVIGALGLRMTVAPGRIGSTN